MLTQIVFVTWDRDLIPAKVAQAANYQGPKEPVSFSPVTHNDRLIYFAKYTSASLGRVKKLYLSWARLKGSMSPEAQELNHLFSRCVDGNRIKIPQHLEDPPKLEAGSPPFVLDVLHDAAANFDRKSRARNDLIGYDYDAVELLLSRDNVAFSEFELLQLTARWSYKHGYHLMDFFEFFDFTQLSAEQQFWVISQCPADQHIPSLVTNGLSRSSLLCGSELEYFKLNHFGTRWKLLFTSGNERLGRLTDVIGETFGLFDKKLVVLRVNTRLTIAIYFPRRFKKYEESLVNDTVRLFSFPHSQEDATTHRRSLPTKVDYRLYYDETGLQLYEKKRANTWIFINRPGQDDKSYKAIEDRGDRRRERQATIDADLNHELIISIALNKFSGNLAKQIGRVNRTPIIGAEVYVISNRDVRSLQVLDQWLEFVDTREVLPLFERQDREYTLPTLKDVDWSSEPEYIRRVVQAGELKRLDNMSSRDISSLLQWLSSHYQAGRLHQVFVHVLQTLCTRSETSQNGMVLNNMIEVLRLAPSQVVAFSNIDSWNALPLEIRRVLYDRSLELLQSFCLAANEMQVLLVVPFRKVLSQIEYISAASFVSLTESIALVVRDSEVALDLLLGCLEPASSWLLAGRPSTKKHLVKNCIGIAMEHLDEANESRLVREDLLELRHDAVLDMVNSRLRIDSHSRVRFATNDHIRLTAAAPPSNSLDGKLYTMDAMVEKTDSGSVTFRCLHPVPSFLEECSWKAKNCGSFVTSKAMLDAALHFATVSDQESYISAAILGFTVDGSQEGHVPPSLVTPRKELNHSQNQALQAAVARSLTCIWGPPGTGKTHTVAVILEELLNDEEARILVTAPTHNAVDNVMRKFLQHMTNIGRSRDLALRVSTDVSPYFIVTHSP